MFKAWREVEMPQFMPRHYAPIEAVWQDDHRRVLEQSVPVLGEGAQLPAARAAGWRSRRRARPRHQQSHTIARYGVATGVLIDGRCAFGLHPARSWAGASGRELIRLQCYEGLDETKALYEWEYAKQMLYTQLLRDKLSQLLSEAETLSAAADRLAAEDVFFSERFLLPDHSSAP